MAVVLRNFAISPVAKETLLCLDLDQFAEGHATVTIAGKPYRWDLSISDRSPQFLPILPGFWQDNVLANLDTLAGVAAREDAPEVKGGFQFSHGKTTYLMDLKLTAEDSEEVPEAKKRGRPRKDAT
jgi:hypothetical protein